MAKQIDFWTLLKLTQEFVSQHYASVLTDKSKMNQLKAYIDKYLRDNDYHVENLTIKELIDKLYCEMAEYSVLTPFLGSTELEEININGWDDIALTYLDGNIAKLKNHKYDIKKSDADEFLRKVKCDPAFMSDCKGLFSSRYEHPKRFEPLNADKERETKRDLN